MATQTEPEKMKSPFPTAFQNDSRTTALDWAVFGCLAAGGVGLVKALSADSPIGVLLCLMGSVASFGLIIYLHLRKS